MSERTDSGRRLNRAWGVGVAHAFYHKDGTFYNVLERFPGALFDPNGYIRFETRHAFETCPYLSIGLRVNVRGTIAQIPGYVRKR